MSKAATTRQERAWDAAYNSLIRILESDDAGYRERIDAAGRLRELFPDIFRNPVIRSKGSDVVAKAVA